MIQIIMTQYTLKTVLSKFKERAEAEFTKGLTQLHVLETFEPVDATKLTKKQRAGAMASLIFLKKNHNGCKKGCSCVDGKKKWETIKKEYTASPTVAIESVFITATVDTHEGWGVAIFGIPGAYIHT